MYATVHLSITCQLTTKERLDKQFPTYAFEVGMLW
jgi:hypothetical protein